MNGKYWIKMVFSSKYSIEEYTLYQYAIADFLSNLVIDLHNQNIFLTTEDTQPYSIINDSRIISTVIIGKRKYSISKLENYRLEYLFEIFNNEEFERGLLFICDKLNIVNIAYIIKGICVFQTENDGLFWTDMNIMAFMAGDGMILYVYIDREYVKEAINAFRQSPLFYFYKNHKISIKCSYFQKQD